MASNESNVSFLYETEGVKETFDCPINSLQENSPDEFVHIIMNIKELPVYLEDGKQILFIY